MKSVLFAAVLFISATSHAIISDSFQCKIEVMYANGDKASSTEHAVTARMPYPNTPSPDVKLTVGESRASVNIQTRMGLLSGGYILQYVHAVKLDKAGKIVDARQQACFVPEGSFCRRSGCSTHGSGCGYTRDPFDANSGWPVVGLSPEGIPLFSDRFLVPLSFDITDGDSTSIVGHVEASCKFNGTYQ